MRVSVFYFIKAQLTFLFLYVFLFSLSSDSTNYLNCIVVLYIIAEVYFKVDSLWWSQNDIFRCCKFSINAISVKVADSLIFFFESHNLFFLVGFFILMELFLYLIMQLLFYEIIPNFDYIWRNELLYNN